MKEFICNSVALLSLKNLLDKKYIYTKYIYTSIIIKSAACLKSYSMSLGYYHSITVDTVQALLEMMDALIGEQEYQKG